MSTELPRLIPTLNPERCKGLNMTDMMIQYRRLYREYEAMVNALSMSNEHSDSVERRMIDAIKQSDHWRVQYQLIIEKNRYLRMPTKKERMLSTDSQRLDMGV